MRENNFSNDPIVIVNQRKIIKKRIIIRIITLLASILFIIGFSIFVIGCEIENMSCRIAGVVIGGVGMIAWIFMKVLFDWEYPPIPKRKK